MGEVCDAHKSLAYCGMRSAPLKSARAGAAQCAVQPRPLISTGCCLQIVLLLVHQAGGVPLADSSLAFQVR